MKKFDNVYAKKFGYFNLYVIRGIEGDILIDTGFIGMKRSLKKWLDNFNIKLIILTHAHVDHVWNVAYLKKLYNCEVAISSLDVNNLDNTKIDTKPCSNKYCRWTKIMSWGMKRFKQEPFEINYFLKNNEIINKYDLKLKIITLPGHTDGSIGVLYKKYLFCGDALVNRKLNRVEIAYQNQDNEKAKKSVNKILRHKPELIFLGHDKEIKFEKLKKTFYNKNKRF